MDLFEVSLHDVWLREEHTCWRSLDTVTKYLQLIYIFSV